MIPICYLIEQNSKIVCYQQSCDDYFCIFTNGQMSKITTSNFDKNILPTDIVKGYIDIINEEFDGGISTNNQYVGQLSSLIKFLNENSFVDHTGFDPDHKLKESDFDTFVRRLRLTRAEQERLQKLGLEHAERALNSKIITKNFAKRILPADTVDDYIDIVNEEFDGNIPTRNTSYNERLNSFIKFLNDKLFVYRTGFDRDYHLKESDFEKFFERLRDEQEDKLLRDATEQNVHALEEVRLERERAKQLERERVEQERLQKREQKQAEKLKRDRLKQKWVEPFYQNY